MTSGEPFGRIVVSTAPPPFTVVPSVRLSGSAPIRKNPLDMLSTSLSITRGLFKLLLVPPFV